MITEELVKTTTEVVTRKDVLNRAADLIEEFGWARGAEGMPNHPDHEGSLCIAGAVYRAGREYGIPEMAESVRHGYLAYLAVGDYLESRSTWIWNDFQWSYKPVVRALRRMADGMPFDAAIRDV